MLMSRMTTYFFFIKKNTKSAAYPSISNLTKLKKLR